MTNPCFSWKNQRQTRSNKKPAKKYKIQKKQDSKTHNHSIVHSIVHSFILSIMGVAACASAGACGSDGPDISHNNGGNSSDLQQLHLHSLKEQGRRYKEKHQQAQLRIKD